MPPVTHLPWRVCDREGYSASSWQCLKLTHAYSNKCAQQSVHWPLRTAARRDGVRHLGQAFRVRVASSRFAFCSKTESTPACWNLFNDEICMKNAGIQKYQQALLVSL